MSPSTTLWLIYVFIWSSRGLGFTRNTIIHCWFWYFLGICWQKENYTVKYCQTYNLRKVQQSEPVISLITRCVFWEGGDTDPLLDPLLLRSPCSLWFWTWSLLRPLQPPRPACPPSRSSTGREGRAYMPTWRSLMGTHTPAPAGPRQNTPFPADTSKERIILLLIQ